MNANRSLQRCTYGHPAVKQPTCDARHTVFLACTRSSFHDYNVGGGSELGTARCAQASDRNDQWKSSQPKSLDLLRSKNHEAKLNQLIKRGTPSLICSEKQRTSRGRASRGR